MEQQTPYDRLFLTRCFFFVALILLCNLLVVSVGYAFLWEKPFHTVLQAERSKFGGLLNHDLSERMRYNGDKLYDMTLVKSGVEGVVYGELDDTAKKADAVAEAMQKVSLFDGMTDNGFDYALLLSYRFGFFTVLMGYFFFIVLALAIHGAVARHRKRYGYGDTPILMNLWARAMLAYAIPVTFLIWTLPLALGPMLLTLSLSCCILGLAIFAFSLPKVA